MERKPTLTYSFSESGDENLFLTLSTRLGEALSNQTVEWRRTYGRASHKFKLRVKILPLTAALLERNDLMTRPYFHIFMTDCSDVDQYRATIRSEISSWLNMLKSHQDIEWIIVVVSGDILSRLTKAKIALPRASIPDKIKTDFCSKSPDRLHILHEPTKESTKSQESWTLLGSKVANMTVRCMELVVSKYEDKVRAERERRNDKSWDFCTYFLLQEEMAFMYEMLGMYFPALVQYDELDAMFTQYVLNANAGDTAHWLSRFSQPITHWHSLLLWKQIDGDARQTILDGTASIIDIRNYLFTRLCRLLFEMGKLLEITQRMHFFLHSISTEIGILEISVPPGAIDCWIFMCCLELVGALRRQVAPKQNGSQKNPEVSDCDMDKEQLVLENASLWNMARIKLYALGELCGLIPGTDTTSRHLQIVVDLLAGMGEGEERGDLATPPALVLREALSSKANFQSQYFELSELAMGTFKHMGHFRSVRSIGSDMASFHLKLEEPNQAENYLVETVRMYSNDGWNLLNTRATKMLAKCYKKMINIKKYLRLCYSLMCDKLLTQQERSFYCDEFKSLATDLGDGHLALDIRPLATVTSVQFIPAQTSFRLNSKHHLVVSVDCLAPVPVTFQSLQVALEHLEPESGPDPHNIPDTVSMSSFLSRTSTESEVDRKSIGSRNYSHNSSQNTGRFSRHKRLASTASSKELMTSLEAELDEDGKIPLVTLNYGGEGHMRQRGSRLSPVLHNIASQRNLQPDGTIAWSGIVCKHANELLRRQDSSQSQLDTSNDADDAHSVAMESYECCLATNNVTLRPGVNQVKFELKTDLEGCFTLHQLRMRLHQSYFVLPRIYPIISYHVSFVKPHVTLEQGDRLISGIVQYFLVSANAGDCVISDESDDVSDGHGYLELRPPPSVRLLAVTKCAVVTPNGEVIDSPSPSLVTSDGNSRVRLPSSALYSTTVLTIACLCQAQEVVQTTDPHKRHRRTHSAPPATFSRSPKAQPRPVPILEGSPPPNNSGGTRRRNSFDSDVTGTPTSDVTPAVAVETDAKQQETKTSRLEELKDSLKKSKNNFRNKFIKSKTPNPVKSGKPHFEDWPTVPSQDPDVIITPTLRINGDLIEVTLDDDDDVTKEHVIPRSPSPASLSASMTKEVTPMTSYVTSSSDENEEPIVLQKKPRDGFCRHAPSRSDAGFNQSLPPLPLKPEDEKNSVTWDITIATPWGNDVAVTSSLVCKRPLDFGYSWSFASARDDQSPSPERLLTVTCDNVTSSALTLRNPRVTIGHVKEVTSLNRDGSTFVCPHGSATFAWKVRGPEFNSHLAQAQLQLDLVSAVDDVGSDDVTSTLIYRFSVENVRPIYSICCSTDPSQPVHCGTMTSLRIDVTRLRHDPGHETTSNGQQLLMFQVMDTRARWAVCGKSSGILSMPGPRITDGHEKHADLGTHVATATLEVMPLLSGSLHLPFVLLHRFMKRRSSEFDEHLSSTESPVLKPPRLIDFERGEILHCNQATQVTVLPPEDPQDQPQVSAL